MKILSRCLAAGIGLASAWPLAAQFIVIEPDAYPRGTILDQVVPEVRLTTAGANNLPIPPTPFSITAAGVPPGYASTGTNVFAHAGVNFFNDTRRLRMDFDGLLQTIYLDAIGSGYNLSPERGHLEAYNSQNVLPHRHLGQRPGSNDGHRAGATRHCLGGGVVGGWHVCPVRSSAVQCAGANSGAKCG
jgi:hypothetical protein